MKIVVDTSAVIAVIVGELAKAKLIELTRGATIVAPPSIDWEIGNAFSAMCKRSRITVGQAVEAVEVYQEIEIEIVEIDLVESLRLAGRLSIYAYDAYFLQCAVEYDLPFISLDRNLVELAKREGIQVVEIE